ncbi:MULTISPECIES: hypothetical protein [Pseudomonas]|uniref:hypothetical protein n=1 Tax=Pseudomonas TaxID=286 RepID=UPI00129B13F9|nr:MULTISPECIES: hypothetical protein [Pseudomonas]MBH3461640.1 hypothetical protein [Pseudomonas putida]MBK0061375.1 hypothetical protein [Pseudomonas sp. S44]
MNQILKIAPLPPINFTDDQRQGITDELLQDDKLWVKINPYFGGQSGDTVELWLGDSQNSGRYLQPVYTVDDPAEFTEVAFTRAELLEHNQTRAFFGYRINERERSSLVGINIDLS